MKTCPHCGEKLIPWLDGPYTERIQKAAALLKDTFEERNFWAEAAMNCFREQLHLTILEATLLWNGVRNSGLLEGLKGRVVYEEWKVRPE